ncbi:MAG: NAD(P)H-dependent glycerol-3-phosphate dehydrogenase [Candidatus Hydrothermarchaeota archaeon]
MKIAIVGTGMFGFALSRYLGKKYLKSKNVEIKAYDSNEKLIDHLKRYRKHLYHFRDKKLPPNISLTNDKGDLLKNAEIVILAIPSPAIREVLREIRGYLEEEVVILNTAKALEIESAKIFSEVIKEEMATASINYEIAKISGGTFARDLVDGAPLGADIACENPSTLKKLQEIFHSNALRIYGNTDLIGVEYAGAFKNVIAILAGIIYGLGLPYGSETHMISRAAKEAKDIAVSLGAKPHTFSMESQCWGNDLWMSCTGKSRNREFGRLIGKGFTPKEALEKMETEHRLVEGYYTTKAIPVLCENIDVETPIFNEIYEMIHRDKNPQESMEYLMSREAEHIEDSLR